eukprot:sb/3464988/
MKKIVKTAGKSEGDAFQVDLEDDRFSGLKSSHLYAIDPSAPEYKSTAQTERLRAAQAAALSEAGERRKEGGGTGNSVLDKIKSRSAAFEKKKQGSKLYKTKDKLSKEQPAEISVSPSEETKVKKKKKKVSVVVEEEVVVEKKKRKTENASTEEVVEKKKKRKTEETAGEVVKKKKKKKKVETAMMMGSESAVVKHPKKRHYRQRAHSNPLSDHSFEYPTSPDTMDWSVIYPDFKADDRVRFCDVGCGYGGLLVTLSTLYPDKFMVGFEIRVKVSDYVNDRFKALRADNPVYNNAGVIRTNAMKYLPNFFRKGQLEKLFILYPDPHFKRCKHKWRIVSEGLLAEYAYVLAEGALVYTVSDVKEVHDWMVKHFTEFPLFERYTPGPEDKAAQVLIGSTEEGKKVLRNKGESWTAIFRRIRDPAEQ